MIKRSLKYILHAEWYNWLYNRVVFKWFKVKSKGQVNIAGRIFVRNNGEISIGANVRINSGNLYNVIGGDTRTNILVGNDAKLLIGNNVGISNSTIICHDSIVIEDNVLIGGGCKIYDTNFHSTNYSSRMKPYFTNGKQKDEEVSTGRITIKRGAWIGGHCVILKEVSIGEESIVGAGSVVTKSIGPKEIWGGNPAQFLKSI